VILGCTEIPLLIGQADRPDLPTLETTGLHVEARLVQGKHNGGLLRPIGQAQLSALPIRRMAQFDFHRSWVQ
jgi:hypothetical protein